MLTMNIKIFSLLLAVLPATALAQEYASAFNTLRLPASSHAAALGGQNVTLIEDEPTAGWLQAPPHRVLFVILALKQKCSQ